MADWKKIGKDAFTVINAPLSAIMDYNKWAINKIKPAAAQVASALSTRYGLDSGQNNVSNSTVYDTPIGPTKDGGNLADVPKVSEKPSWLNNYSSGSGSSGGGYSSSYASSTPSAQDIYEQQRAIYERQYNEAKNRAQQSYERDLLDLKTVLDRATDTYNTQKEDYNKYYDTQASNLAKSIERFREQNKENVASQRKAYLSNQAALEAAREQADRQNRISAAARGLGGSGLQQLAQLQNLLSQGQEISDVATENQSAMDKLRLSLSQAEEDYNDKLTQSETARDKALRDISTTLKNAQEDYETNKEKAKANLDELLEKYETGRAANDVSALTDLYNRVASSSSRGSGGSGSSTNNAALSFLVDQFQSNLDDLASMSDKEFKTYKENNNLSNSLTKQQVANSLLNETTSNAIDYGLNNDYGNYRQNLNSILAGYNLQKQEENKESSWWNSLLNKIANG